MSQVNMSNSRDPEQRRRMQKLIDAGICYFCRGGSEEEQTLPTTIHETEWWYVCPNNFPYLGSVHHYLLVPKRHMKRASELDTREIVELFELLAWLEDHLGVTGYSMFARSGDMEYTGATLDHLHFHFLVGEKKTEDMTAENRLLVTLGWKK